MIDYEAKLAETLDELVTPCIGLDADFSILYRNPAAEALSGSLRLADGLRAVFAATQLDAIRASLDSGHTAALVPSPLAERGAGFYFLPFRPSGPLYLAFIDLGEPRGAEAARKPDLAGVVDAAFRRPTGEIFANLAALNRKLEARDDRSLETGLDVINAQTYVLLRNWTNVSEAIRAFTQNLPERRPVDFWERMSELCEAAFEVAKQSGYDIRFDFPEPAVSVRCSFPSIARVVMNLLSNALRACGKKGSVTMTGRTQPHSVAVSVNDDGCGAADASSLFEPYVSDWSEENGAGLGLPVSKQIIYSHGGTMTMTTAPGGGTSVTFTLPRCDEPPEERSPLECGSVRYTGDRFSEVYVGLCGIVDPPRA